MTENRGERRGVLPRLNFNTGVALGVILLGVVIWLLIPSQVAEPPSFFGRSSSGISPKLMPQILAAGFVIFGICYLIASPRIHEANSFKGMPLSAYVNVGLIVIAMAAYVTLLIPLGYIASSVAVAIAISVYYGSRSLTGIAITGVVMPVVIYLIFTKLLGVLLPPFPWGRS